MTSNIASHHFEMIGASPAWLSFCIIFVLSWDSLWFLLLEDLSQDENEIQIKALPTELNFGRPLENSVSIRVHPWLNIFRASAQTN
jgi:hypothetical protein